MNACGVPAIGAGLVVEPPELYGWRAAQHYRIECAAKLRGVLAEESYPRYRAVATACAAKIANARGVDLAVEWVALASALPWAHASTTELYRRAEK